MNIKKVFWKHLKVWKNKINSGKISWSTENLSTNSFSNNFPEYLTKTH